MPLVFCEHQGKPGGVRRKDFRIYKVVDRPGVEGWQRYMPLLAQADPDEVIVAYAAVAPCARGDHYLALDADTGQVVERNLGAYPYLYHFPDVVAAQAAIDQYAGAAADRASASGETPQEPGTGKGRR